MIKINYEICDDCGTCISVCPRNALVFGDGEKLRVDDKCVTCGLCVGVCPFAALTLEGRS